MTTALASNRDVLADADLARMESEVGDVEARLEGDLVSARRGSVEVLTRLAEFQAMAAQAVLEGAVEEVAAVHARQLLPPVFDESDARARVRAARLGALQQRRLACGAVRSSLEAFVATTAKFADGLARDAAELRVLQQRPRAQAAQVGAPAPKIAVGLPGEESALEAALLAAAESATPAPRRSSGRIALQTSIDFGSDSNFYAGFSTNLSEGGVFVATVMHPARGAMVDLRFSLPDDTVIETRGVVRWTRELNDATPDVMPGAGIQFVGLSVEAATAIREFVSKREPLFYVD